MITILSHALKRNTGQILGWGISLGILAIYVVSLFNTFVSQSEEFSNLVNAYPPELMAAFGGTADIFSPPGFLNFTIFSYMPLILGIYAILAGSGLLVSDEENGTLDLVLAYPVSRSGLFFGRLAAFILSLIAILAITWLGFIVILPGSGLNLTILEIALPNLDLLAVITFFGMLALLLSMLTPSRRIAAMIAGLALVASFFLTTLTQLNGDLKKYEKLNPMHYYRGGYSVEGLEWRWFLGLVGVALVFALLAWWLFLRRDIRIGGEGGWSISNWRGKSRRKQGAEPEKGFQES